MHPTKTSVTIAQGLLVLAALMLAGLVGVIVTFLIQMPPVILGMTVGGVSFVAMMIVKPAVWRAPVNP